uniref:SGNH/GDSL hydrolase family protein n=1 Tax=Prevotella sp. GTC17253 TaxID=3236793 RepID=A0AB33IYV4_9BACT
MLKRFYIKSLLIALPFLSLAGYYVAKDPFMVLRPYTDYDHSEVYQSEGTIAWLKYKRYRAQQHYDSFIMGTSTTMSFPTTYWQKYIQGSPFRMFGNSEGIGDIALKLEALDRQKDQKIRHLLIVLEPNSLYTPVPQAGIMHAVPPEVSGKSEGSFQAAFFQSFCSPQFLFPYLQYQFTHRMTRKMKGIIEPDMPTRTTYTNDAIIKADKQMKEMGEKYWTEGPGMVVPTHNHTPRMSPQYIYGQQMECLRRIKSICRRHQTEIRLVIGPRPDKLLTNPSDVKILQDIFGKENVYNFASRSYLAWTDYHNFYDGAHFTISLGQHIIDLMYADKVSATR